LWGNLKDKMYKTNPHTLEEPKNKIHHEISAISMEELQTVNTRVFCRCLSAFGQGGAIFSASAALVSF
jgi:hypothetical protein